MSLPPGWTLELRHVVGQQKIDTIIITEPVPIPRKEEIIKDFSANLHPIVRRVCYNYSKKRVYVTCV